MILSTNFKFNFQVETSAILDSLHGLIADEVIQMAQNFDSALAYDDIDDEMSDEAIFDLITEDVYLCICLSERELQQRIRSAEFATLLVCSIHTLAEQHKTLEITSTQLISSFAAVA